jgi:hypothetical protein
VHNGIGIEDWNAKLGEEPSGVRLAHGEGTSKTNDLHARFEAV